MSVVRQGSVHYYAASGRRLGRRFGLSFRKERACVVVSVPEFHHTPWVERVWTVPAADEGGGFAVERLGHVAFSDLGEQLDVLGETERWRLVDFLVWGVTGDEPRPEFPDAYRARHAAAIAAGGYPRPGDVVPHGGELFAVISGVAFNADDDLDVVWAAPLGEDGSVSISRVTSLPKQELPAPVGQVRNLDGVRHTARWILTGEQ